MKQLASVLLLASLDLALPLPFGFVLRSFRGEEDTRCRCDQIRPEEEQEGVDYQFQLRYCFAVRVQNV